MKISLLRAYCRFASALALTIHCICMPAPVAAEPDTAKRLMNEVFSRVKFYRLDNGLRVILYPRGVAPVFSGLVDVRVGGSDELQGHTGISHLLEHMAFKGTQTIGTTNFEKEKPLLDRMEEIARASDGGTALNTDQKKEWDELEAKLQALLINNDFFQKYEAHGATQMNASTSADSTNYFNSFPRAAFELWCKMEADRLKNPVMRQFYKERDVVMEERRTRFEDSPDGRLYEQLLGVAYAFHPYRNPVIGYEEDIRKVTATQVAEFHRRFYVPENIVLAVVGDVDPEKDIEIIKKYFGDIPARPGPARLQYIEPPQRGERRLTLEMKASPVMFIAYHKPAYPDADDPRISILLEVLAGSSTSPLYEELVKRQQVAASVSFEEAPGIAHPSLIFFSLNAKRPHTGDDLLRAFDTVLKNFVSRPIDEQAVIRAKRAMAVDFIRELRSDLGLAKDLASSELIFGDWRATLRWFDQLMAVTPEEIKQVALKYLRPENRTIGQIVQREEH